MRTMNPLLSYFRHVIVIGVFYLIEKYKLPTEGAEEAVTWAALIIVTSISWLVTKYGLQIFKRIKIKLGLTLIAFVCLLLPSCTAAQRANFPVVIGIKSDGLEAAYSSKGGLEIGFIVDSNTGK